MKYTYVYVLYNYAGDMFVFSTKHLALNFLKEKGLKKYKGFWVDKDQRGIFINEYDFMLSKVWVRTK